MVSDIIRTSHQAKVWLAHGDDCEGCKALGPGELEAIVRDLAATEPLLTKGEPVHGEWEQCGVCGAVNRWVGDTTKHDMDCVWWNAAAWVLDHPVSETKTTDE